MAAVQKCGDASWSQCQWKSNWSGDLMRHLGSWPVALPCHDRVTSNQPKNMLVEILMCVCVYVVPYLDRAKTFLVFRPVLSWIGDTKTLEHSKAFVISSYFTLYHQVGVSDRPPYLSGINATHLIQYATYDDIATEMWKLWYDVIPISSCNTSFTCD